MASKQRIAYGAVTEWSDTEGGTFERIPECDAIVVPEEAIEYQDVTSLDSEGGYREFVPGLTDPGEVTIPAGYTSEGFEKAFTYKTGRTLVYFRTTLPLETGQATGDTFTFKGYVSPQLQQTPVGDVIKMNITVRISGNVVAVRGGAA